MAKTNFSEVSTSKITIEAQPGGVAAATSSLGTVATSGVTNTGNISNSGTLATTGALSLGTGNAVSAAAAKASTHQVAIAVNGTTYYFLVSNV